MGRQVSQNDAPKVDFEPYYEFKKKGEGEEKGKEPEDLKESLAQAQQQLFMYKRECIRINQQNRIDQMASLV
jgi:hypothetical protein